MTPSELLLLGPTLIMIGLGGVWFIARCVGARAEQKRIRSLRAFRSTGEHLLPDFWGNKK